LTDSFFLWDDYEVLEAVGDQEIFVEARHDAPKVGPRVASPRTVARMAQTRRSTRTTADRMVVTKLI